jgi:hypothetical protein
MVIHTMATFIASILPIVGVLGVLLFITEGIVPCIGRWWHRNDDKRQIGKIISRSRNY